MRRFPTRFALRVIPLLLAPLFALPAAADTALRDTMVTANRHETDVDQLNATVTSVDRRDMERIDQSGNKHFRTPGYAVSDLVAWIRPTTNTRLVVAFQADF